MINVMLVDSAPRRRVGLAGDGAGARALHGDTRLPRADEKRKAEASAWLVCDMTRVGSASIRAKALEYHVAVAC